MLKSGPKPLRLEGGMDLREIFKVDRINYSIRCEVSRVFVPDSRLYATSKPSYSFVNLPLVSFISFLVLRLCLYLSFVTKSQFCRFQTGTDIVRFVLYWQWQKNVPGILCQILMKNMTGRQKRKKAIRSLSKLF